LKDRIGPTDPAFTLRPYTHMMRRDDGEREALTGLVEGRDLGSDWALMGTGTEDRASDALSGDVPKTRKAPR
jgi:hypothetical protein